MLQATEVLPGPDAEALRSVGIELAGPFIFDERISERGAIAVIDGDRGDHIAVAPHGLGGLELDDRQLEGKPAVDDGHRAHQVAQAPGSVERERLLALAQGE